MAINVHTVCLVAAVMAFDVVSAAQPAPMRSTEAVSAQVTDEVFVAQAVRNGRAEVELSKIALTKAVRPDVKVFAQRMVDDHTKTNAELAALASEKNTVLPVDPVPVDSATLEKLEKLTDEAFDRMYIDQMTADHQRAVEAFTAQAEKGTDPVLKAWVAKTLPALQHHLEMARELGKKLES